MVSKGLLARRRTVRLGLLLVAMGMAVVYPIVAWACTTMSARFAWEQDGTTPTVQPGSQVRGVLKSWWSGPIEIYWGYRDRGGRLIETIPSGANSFDTNASGDVVGMTVTVTVPIDAPAGDQVVDVYAVDPAHSQYADKTRGLTVALPSTSAPGPAGPPQSVLTTPSSGGNATGARVGTGPTVPEVHRSSGSRVSTGAPIDRPAAVVPAFAPDQSNTGAVAPVPPINGNVAGDVWSGFSTPGQNVIGFGTPQSDGRGGVQFAAGAALLLCGLAALGTAATRVRGRVRQRVRTPR